MDMLKIVFSPVGGTQRVADILTEKLGENVKNVDLTDAKADFGSIAAKEEDIVLIAVPSYGGRVPSLAAQRLSRIKGNGAKCIIVCVYGNRAYEDTLVELQDIAEDCGFNVIAAVTAVAEHSIVHKYGAGRPDSRDVEDLNGFALKIADKIKSSGDTPLQLPGNRPYENPGAVTLIPKADGKCISCGLCAQKCPAQAISYENNRVTDGKKCIECMRCVEICPKSARKINKAMLTVAAVALKKVCAERKDNELFI